MHKLEIGDEELELISRALDLYSRIGLLQFDYIPDYCYSLDKMINDREGFKDKCKELKTLLGYTSNGGPGIFNKSVGEDVRTAAHMHQQIRHHFWNLNDNPNKSTWTVNAYPADICNISGDKIPDLKIEI